MAREIFAHFMEIPPYFCWTIKQNRLWDLYRTACTGWPGTYSQEQLQHLAVALGSVQLEVELNMEKLVLQTFADMNHYENV